MTIFRFTCGHIGRSNESHRSKATAFIRVAELRGLVPQDVDKSCPDCGGGAHE